MKRLKLILVIMILMILSSCGGGYSKITAVEAKKMMDNQIVTILDVRTQEEYNSGHIENAVLLPDYEVKAKAENVLKDKNAVILVYCRTGNRSARASRDLISLGYKKVYDFGGIVDWPYKTVN